MLGFLFAAKLNASKAITLPEFLEQRFQSKTVRWIAAWGAILCSSIYLVAQIYGIGLVASMLSGLTFELGVFLALGGILLCSFLGGMRAVTWTQVVQCVLNVKRPCSFQPFGSASISTTVPALSAPTDKPDASDGEQDKNGWKDQPEIPEKWAYLRNE